MKNNVHPDKYGKTVAIVAAGGIGSRFSANTNKQFVMLGGKPVLAWSLAALEACPLIDEIIPVVHEYELTATESLIKNFSVSKVQKIVPGGIERNESVMNGLIAAGSGTDIVIIHDGARPLITTNIITQVILGLEGYDGSIAAVPVKDTIKRIISGQQPLQVEKTLNRLYLWSVQTPQVFLYTTLLDALVKGKNNHFSGTDDASFVEQNGGIIHIVSGSYRNIKITTLEDIYIAEAFLYSENNSVKQVHQ